MTHERRRLRAVHVLLAIAGLVARPPAALARQAEASPLTLTEALARAMSTSQRLAEALARTEAAAAAVRSREVSDAPSVGVVGGYTRTNHVEPFGVPQPNGVLRVIYPDVPDNYFGRATLQWPIYTAGRTDALVRAARSDAAAVAAEADLARADLRLEVTRAYWALRTATETVRVVQEAVTRADAHLADVRARFESGFLPPNEVASAQALKARQDLQLIEARNLEGNASLELARLTGVSDVVPRDSLESAASVVDVPSSVAADRPELRAIAERITASEHRTSAILTGRKPVIAAHAAGDYANPNPRIFPRTGIWRTSWEVGVAVNWMPWDGGRIEAESVESRLATRAIRARQAEVESLIATEVRQRRRDLDAARAGLSAADAGVRAAAEARRVVGERFDVGVATSGEVRDAQVALLQAELDRTRALANIRLAEARLTRALGLP